MKIKSVIIEGFHNVLRKKYDFEDINYLHGLNGAGKSTVLQAIQLGLLGYVPGTNKTKQGIFSHSNSHTMAVKLILDDDGTEVSIQRIWTKSKSSVTENLEIEPDTYDIKSLISDVELPLFNFDEFAHMTANTLKDWFINYLPRQTYKTDWRSVLKDSMDKKGSSLYETLGDDFINEAVSAISDFHVEGLEEVRQANTYFKSQLSFMKSELTRKSSTIQSLIYYDDFDDVYTVEELKSTISNLENRIVQASINAENYKKKKLLAEELASLESGADNTSFENIMNQISNLQKKYEEAEKESREHSAKHQEYLHSMKSYDSVISSGGVCNFTNKKCEEIANLVEAYKKVVEDLKKKSEEESKKADEAYNRSRGISESISKLHSDLNLRKNNVTRYNSLKSAYDSIVAYDTMENIEGLQEQLENYKLMYEKAAANKKYNELNDIIVHDKYRIEQSIEALKAWVDLTGVNGLQAQSNGENPFDVLAEEVDKVLNHLITNRKVSCRFNSEGKANSFSFGIYSDDSYVPYNLLSSGEKCLFVLSLFIALLNYNHSSLNLILIDDFLDHLDDDNFQKIFEVLKERTNIQFIFAGVKPVSSSICNVILVER